MTYYAVCDALGPISVRLAGETEQQAREAFAAMDGQRAIDRQKTEMEDALGIDGSDMDEGAFREAIESLGATYMGDLDPIANAHAGTVAHLEGGWCLYGVHARG